MLFQAGHSVRVRPRPIPNLEVKPNVAVVLLRCESSWEATVLAFLVINIDKNNLEATCQAVLSVESNLQTIYDS